MTNTIPLFNVRYSGIYQAKVVNVADLSAQSRIQCLIPVLSEFATTPTTWAPPALAQGTTGPLPAPPALGSVCWILFSGGVDTAPMWFPPWP